MALQGAELLISVLRDMRSGSVSLPWPSFYDLTDILLPQASAIPQSSALGAPRAPLITFADSVLDFSVMPAEVIIRRHNAISHQVTLFLFSPIRFLIFFDQRPLTVYLPNQRSLQLHYPTVASVYPPRLSDVPGTARYHVPTNSMVIRCADGSVLQVPKVKQQAKALLDARDWWNGVKGLGMVSNGELRFQGGST